MIYGIPFLPLEIVENFLKYHLAHRSPKSDNAEFKKEIESFQNYINKQWLPCASLWNQNANALEGGPRTTNHAEGYHNGLPHHFDTRHPSLGEFLNYVQIHHNSSFRKIRFIRESGSQAKKRRPQDIALDQTVKEKVMAFNQRFYGGPDVRHDGVTKFCFEMSSIVSKMEDSGIDVGI